MALRVRSRVCKVYIDDKSLLTAATHKFFSAQLNNAVRAWLRAVLVNVPQYTGTSRGTFKPLGRVLKVSVPKGKVGPLKRPDLLAWRLKKGTHTVKGVTYRVGPDENNYAQYTLEYNYPLYKFTFTQNLPWAFWNDIQPAPNWMHLVNPTPWGAIKAGNAAFQSYVANEMPTRKFYQAIMKSLIKRKIERP